MIFPNGATDEELKNIQLSVQTGFSFPIPPQCPEDFDKGGMSQPTIAEKPAKVIQILKDADIIYKWISEVEGSGVKPTLDTRIDEKASKKKDEGEDKVKHSNIDVQWLEETLKIIKWKEATALSWIKNTLKFEPSGNLVETCNKLNADQLHKFVKKLQEMREAAGE